MKLNRSVLGVVAMVIGLAATTGCKSNSPPEDEPPAGPPTQPVAQGPSDPSTNDPTARRARRHKGRHWPRDGRPRREWRRDRSENAPSEPPAQP